ncbi:RGG repeats nuclear RNA binding protein A-like [Punica granatum]|uniref:Hyaluronan/mRNA-binding protein domain-containing protein n=2 Tax=Punica granatum TaxID=22663 RepID=A0A218XU51_PUNGR|nr:RGG repeats nuclear RNA binding protein A-like [Punica granatum]OWM88338.1 hypothetical protein CDL15_Pgr003750 [Punica granatum]PKI38109.1 hypothetical protein CRG98_041474 [Punica granatum]
MATANPFDLLVDDDNEDVTQLVAAAQQLKVEKPKKDSSPGQGAQPAAKLPSKPLPPAQAVREVRNEGGRGGGRGGRGYGRGRGGGRGSDRDSNNYESSFSNNNGFSGGYRPSEEGDSGRASERRGGPRGGYRGGRRGGFSNGEDGEGERPRRVFERRSGTGRGNELKREGAGRGNWGTPADEVAVEVVETINEVEKTVDVEKPVDEDVADAGKESPVKEPEEQEPEDKEMTLEEYEKVLEEKRKVLLASKTEQRKVDTKAFESMQPLSNKKNNDDVFIKLGSEKDKRKDADKEDKAKKSLSINDFLKPAEGDRHYSPGSRGRGRGRGRGPRSDVYTGGYAAGNSYYNTTAPAIEDLGQFPSLGGKN